MPDDAREGLGSLGRRRNPAHIKVIPDRWTKLSVWLSIAALILSGVTLVVTVVYTFSPGGEVSTLEPGSYSIIRLDTLGWSRGDSTAEHLVLPVELKNENGRSKLIRQLELTVRELEGDNEQVFDLVKEYPEMSDQAFLGDFEFRNSLSLEPHSVSTRALSFRSKDRYFRFEPYRKYEATLGFLQDDKSERDEEPSWQFCTYGTSSLFYEDVETAPSVVWDWWRIGDEVESGESCDSEE